MLICTISDLFLAVTSKGGGFPGGSVGTESAYNAGDPGSIPGLGKSWRRQWQLKPVFLPGKSHGFLYPGGLQSMGLQESDMTKSPPPPQ